MADNLNYIKQIAAGGQTYDIAVAHGLTFKTGTKTQAWDGISDVEVVIPTLADLVQDPIRFAGTVGSDGIAKNNGVEITPAKGDLVYITADCTFGGKTCEAGDMAVYDGSVWNVVSGENQVSIKAGTTPADGATEVEISATAKSVLYVEGKELALKLPANLVKSNLGVVKNSAGTFVIDSSNTVADVQAKYITLSYTAANEDTKIGSNKDIALPTVLADGKVNFTGDTALVKPIDITGAWTKGTDGSHKRDAVEFAISGDVTLTAATGTDFVTSVTPSSDSFVKNALKSASLKVAATKEDNETIAVNPVLTSNPVLVNDTTEFATGIATTSTDADFTIPGAVSVASESSKKTTNGVLVDVVLPTYGDASTPTDAAYVSANASTGVISSIGDPTVSISMTDNASNTVVATATVTDHVLSFTTTTVSASAKQGTATYKKAQYTKTVLNNTPSVSYGSIQTAAGQGYKLNKQAVSAKLNDGVIKYIGVDTANTGEAEKASAVISVGSTTGKYTAAIAAGSKGNIESGKVVTSVTDAKVPVLGTITPSGSIAGSVATALTTNNVKVGVFENDAASINIGTWALGESNESTSGGIAVGMAGDAQVSGSVIVPVDTFITEIYADADLAGAPAKSDTDKVNKLNA